MANCNSCTADVVRSKIFPILPEGCKSCLSIDHVLVLVYKAVVILSWAAEFIAIFLLIYAAILYFTSTGDESKTSMAKKIITAVVIGLIIIFLSRWFLYFITAAMTPQGNLINIIDLTNTH